MIKASVTYDKAALMGLMKYGTLGSPAKLAAYIFLTLFTAFLTVVNIGSNAFVTFIIMFAIVLAVDIAVIYAYFIKPKASARSF